MRRDAAKTAPPDSHKELTVRRLTYRCTITGIALREIGIALREVLQYGYLKSCNLQSFVSST
jgi:hypothetical protein